MLSVDVFRALRAAIHRRSGMWFADSALPMLQSRLAPRLDALQLESFQSYVYFLQYDPHAEREFDAIYDVVTTAESYFFREPAQLKAFVEEIVPELVPSRSPIRVWSAGCAAGEEPYSIAMLLHQAGWYERASFEIFGSDLSQQALARARAGVYRANAFRATDPQLRDRYFTARHDGTWQLCDEIRGCVSFGKLNLYDASRVAVVGTVDVIFCRNVIIYFDQDAKRTVVANFYDRLAPGGYLLLGHSESLINLSTQFKLRHLNNDMVYQRD